MEIALATSALLVVGGLSVGLVSLMRIGDALRSDVERLAATVAKMQADQRTQPRAAGAPPVGAFSFKGASK